MILVQLNVLIKYRSGREKHTTERAGGKIQRARPTLPWMDTALTEM